MSKPPSSLCMWCVLSHVRLSSTSVHGILRAGILQGLPFPPPGDLPNPGIRPMPLASPALQADALSLEPTGKPSVSQFSRSVVTDSLRPHESQHTRPPCPSPAPGVYSDSCPSSHWCHPAISSSAVPFSSCLQALPASGSFPVSQLFAWGGQSTGVSASALLYTNPREEQMIYWSVERKYSNIYYSYF